jgi:hypothetical protein
MTQIKQMNTDFLRTTIVEEQKNICAYPRYQRHPCSKLESDKLEGKKER